MSAFADLANSIPSSGGKFFRAAVGDNRVRLVSMPIKTYRPVYVKGANDFRYCLTAEGAAREGFPPGSVKFAVWVIDRTDGQVKCYEMGKQVMDLIAEYSTTDGYKFDTVPDYDFIIKRKDDGGKTSYQVLPHPTKGPLTPAEEQAVKAEGDLTQFLREKAEDRDMVAPF